MAKSRVLRSTSAYRAAIDRLGTFRIVHPLETLAIANRIGFESTPNVGDCVLPTVIGPVTSYNAHGRQVVRRDLPKEGQVRVINTSWKDWHGYTHHGSQTREYQVYPREIIPPPSESLITLERGGQLIGASRELSWETPEADVVHVINVFLELFGAFEIVAADLSAPVAIRKLNWKILPPGAYPFDRARDALHSFLDRLEPNSRDTATQRIRTITRHKPDFLAVGVGGFSDYVVFGFTQARRYVFESPQLGNATYIFRNDWEAVSGLTKAEILQESLQEARLIHNKRWSFALHEVIARS